MLIIPLSNKQFDMIVSGEQKELYRDVDDINEKKLMGVFGDIVKDPYFLCGKLVTSYYDIIIKKVNEKHTPIAVIRAYLKIGLGRQEWGAKEKTLYYVLQVGKVIPVDKYLDVGIWKEVNSSGYVTPGGDPLYECPYCGSTHVYGIEANVFRQACEKCGRLMKYSWQKD